MARCARAPLLEPVAAGEASAEDHAGRLRQHADVAAGRGADQLQDGGLARTGATGEHDPAGLMRLVADTRAGRGGAHRGTCLW